MDAAPEGLQDPPGRVHAPQEVKSSVVPRQELAGGHACSFPFPLPQLALCISIHGSFVHASRGTHNPMLLL